MVVAPKTTAFLQAGPERAFADLEQVLRRALAASSSGKSGNNKGESKRSRDGASSPATAAPNLQASGPAEYPFGAGCVAQLDGLASQPSLNGCKVEVLGFDTAKGRFMVKLLAGGQGFDHDGTEGGGAAPSITNNGSSSENERVIAVRPCSLAPLNSGDDDGARDALSNLQSIEAPPSVSAPNQGTKNIESVPHAF